MKPRLLAVIALVGLVVGLYGCGTGEPSPSVEPFDSPLGVAESPLPSPATNLPEITPFQLEKPIPDGATRVTGTGPAGVPILLIDITLGGSMVDFGVVDQDGVFEFDLPQPLEARHRIGLTLGDLEGTGWQNADFYNEGFYGDEAINVPQIGFFFDTCLVGK